MIAALARLWRRWPVAIYALVGIVVALVLVAVIPFGPRTLFAGKILVTFMLAVGVFIAAIFWTIEIVSDVARWIARRGRPPEARPLVHSGRLPALSSARQAQVRRAVKLMTEAGILDSGLDPALLYAGVAQHDEPVKPVVILDAMLEADYYHPGFSWSAYMTNLVQHGAHVEQPKRYLAEQIDDLAKLGGGALDVRGVVIEMLPRKGSHIVDTRIEMIVNGEAVRLAYAGADKALSTVIHHDLATRFRALGDGRRLAWMWDDIGPWISCLTDGTVEELNAAFKLGPRAAWRWTWIDDEAPFAAGEV